MSESEILETHLQELRRGTVVLACLCLLETPGYGYGLLEELGEREIGRASCRERV